MRISPIHRALCISAALAVFTIAAPAHADDSKNKSDEMVTCKDGSTAKRGQGACGHHGGVAPATAKCKDGSMSHAESHSGACAGHGGVDKWLDSKDKEKDKAMEKDKDKEKSKDKSDKM